MNKNNDKFNDEVKRNVEELHKLKEDVKKTDDPKIKQRVEQLYNKRSAPATGSRRSTTRREVRPARNRA